MSHYITIEEQERLGIRDKPSNFITPFKSDEITHVEGQVINSALSAASTVMSGRQMSHLAKSDDTALTNVFASLFYSIAYGVAGAMIVAPILLLAFWAIGGDEEIYYLLFLLLWGVCILVSLYYNRWQGLWFSPAGLDHAEIKSRERIAIHAIDKHIELVQAKWRLKS